MNAGPEVRFQAWQDTIRRLSHRSCVQCGEGEARSEILLESVGDDQQRLARHDS